MKAIHYNIFDNYGNVLLAKCIIGVSNAVVPTFTAMLYPTLIRNAGVGFGNLAAGFGLILVPYIWLLVNNRSY